jgi:hypothetical protein
MLRRQFLQFTAMGAAAIGIVLTLRPSDHLKDLMKIKTS